MSDKIRRETESPTHQRATFNDPLRDGLDPTAPGSPHEADGEAQHQSRRSHGTPVTAKSEDEERHDAPKDRD